MNQTQPLEPHLVSPPTDPPPVRPTSDLVIRRPVPVMPTLLATTAFLLLMTASLFLWWRTGQMATRLEEVGEEVSQLQGTVVVLHSYWPERTVTPENAEADQPFATAVSTVRSTPSPVARLEGHLAMPGNPALVLRLATRSGDAWQEVPGSGLTLPPDGTFSFDLSSNQPRENHWLGIPASWELALTGVGPTPEPTEDTTWWPLLPGNELITLQPGQPVRARYVFSGLVYFQGVDAPERVMARLQSCDSIGQCAEAIQRQPIFRPISFLTHTVGVTFTLESLLEVGSSFRLDLVAEDNGDLDWATSASPETATVDGRAIVITPVVPGPLTVEGLIFAGPLPILLDFHAAEYQPPIPNFADRGLEWQTLDRPDGPTGHPYMTRDEPNMPEDKWARWPVWLPVGDYQLVVLLPGRNQSATAIYQLVTGIDSGEVSVIWTSDPLSMCDTGEDSVTEHSVVPLIRWSSDGLSWLYISDLVAGYNPCSVAGKTYLYRLPIYQLRLERVN